MQLQLMCQQACLLMHLSPSSRWLHHLFPAVAAQVPVARRALVRLVLQPAAVAVQE